MDTFDFDDESADPVVDEHHAMFELVNLCLSPSCSELFANILMGPISLVSHVSNQPECKRLAKFLAWFRI